MLELFEKPRKAKHAVPRAVVVSVGRSAKKTLLASVSTSAADNERLKGFQASNKWAKNFVVRNGLASTRLHGEAGSVNPELVAKVMKEIREECKNNLLEDIYNVDETSIQWKIVPKRTYLSTHENRQTVRGTKDMNFEDRVSVFMCTNASGTEKVEMTIIGRAKSPRCFRRRACPLECLSQANA